MHIHNWVLAYLHWCDVNEGISARGIPLLPPPVLAQPPSCTRHCQSLALVHSLCATHRLTVQHRNKIRLHWAVIVQGPLPGEHSTVVCVPEGDTL